MQVAAGASAGEIRFPRDGTKEDLQQWFLAFEEGQYFGKWEKTPQEDRPKPIRMIEMTKEDLNDWLGKPTGSIIHNAIHKHDRPAATTSATAATGRLRCLFRIRSYIFYDSYCVAYPVGIFQCCIRQTLSLRLIWYIGYV